MDPSDSPVRGMHWTGVIPRRIPGQPGTPSVRLDGCIGGGPPGSLVDLLGRWADDMQVRNFTASGIRQYLAGMGLFGAWCAERSIRQAPAVTRGVVEAFQRHLSRSMTRQGTPLKVTTQANYLQAVISFFSWCVLKHHLPASPAAGLQLPRRPKTLPPVLTLSELERIFAAPDVSTPLGLRDRAVVEMLYGTGLRRTEIGELTIDDVDMDALVVRVNQGKGRKDRISPITPRTAAWVERYRIEARPMLFQEARSRRALFLSSRGWPMRPGRIGGHIGKLVHEDVEIRKRGACHLFRHAMATHLLDRGCDVRVIQEFLGHACLSSTEVYTHVSMEHLRVAQKKYHPLATTGASDLPPELVDPVIFEDDETDEGDEGDEMPDDLPPT